MIIKPIQKNVLLFGWVASVGLWSTDGLCQSFASARANAVAQRQETPPPVSRSTMRSLVDVLRQLEKQYGVVFSYNNRFIGGKIVETTRILDKNERRLETVLNRMLPDLDLMYEKVSAQSYLIYEKTKARSTPPAQLKSTPQETDNSAPATNAATVVIPLVGRQVESLANQPTDRTITGRVTDGSNGTGLPGVSIVLKGTGRGTTTDGEGSYRLNVPDGGGTLIFSFIGYVTQEVAIGNQTSVDVSLVVDNKTLNEVVVVGYGTQQRKDVTGSIASLNTQAIRDQPITNIGEGLAGRLPGVLAQQTSGAPGSVPAIKIRGLGSISAGTGPLVVVDGQPLNDGALNLINPNDIQSVDVLKDASATAIYGSRGSNGVIMITTKRGKAGQMRINLDYYTGVQEVAKRMDILNSQQFAEFSKEAANNAYVERVQGAQITDPNDKRPTGQRYRYPRGEIAGLNFDDPASLPYYDYQDLIFRRAPISSYQVTASGGSDKVQFLVSGNYLNQDGIIKKSSLDRYSLRSNIDAQLSPKLKVGLNFSPSFTLENRINTDGHWASNGIVNSALSIMPIVPVYAADGSYTSQAAIAASYDYPGITNPVANITEVDNRFQTTRLLGNFYATLELLKGLTYRGTVGGDVILRRQDYFQKSTLPLNQLLPPTANSGYSYTSQNLNWVANQTLTYNRQFNEVHNLEALIGMEAQKNDYEQNRVEANRFPNDGVQTVNYGTVNSGYSYREQWSLASYFARVAYNYKDRYLLNVSVRRDGSSRFGQNNRWGTFPSGSIGWRVSEEAFMKSVPVISDLKLRVSYGLAGNNAFSATGNLQTSTSPSTYTSPNYIAIGLLGVDNYVLGNNLINGLAARTLDNANLTWEKSRQLDLGLELGLLQNRIFLTADYYNRITTDLLLSVQVPTLTDFGSIVKNIGEVENKGWEFGLTTRNVTGSFTWSTDLNLSLNRNKVRALGPTGDPIRSGTGVGETNITVIGQPLGNLFGYVQLGVFRGQADLDSYPHFADSRPGDVKFADINNDKKIDANDRTIIGNNQPDFLYGMTNTFSYKGIDLGIVIQGVQGGKILNLSRRFYENLEGNANQITTVLDRWRSPQDPGNGKTPRANSRSTGNNNQVSTRWVEDGSYLRIRNITLGYNLPKNLVSKAKLQTVRLYGGVQNAFTFSKYLSYNPEVSQYENPLTGGVDYGTYPLPRTYTIGINIGF